MEAILLAALLAGAPDAAAQPDPQAPAASNATAAAAPAKAPEKLVCQNQDDTGSIMVRRVCHTREQWAQIQAQNDGARPADVSAGTVQRFGGGASPR